MYRWVNDSVPFAGAAFRQWIVEFYQDNLNALHLGLAVVSTFDSSGVRTGSRSCVISPTTRKPFFTR